MESRVPETSTRGIKNEELKMEKGGRRRLTQKPDPLTAEKRTNDTQTMLHHLLFSPVGVHSRYKRMRQLEKEVS